MTNLFQVKTSEEFQTREEEDNKSFLLTGLILSTD